MLKHLMCAATVVAASSSLLAQTCQNLGTSLGDGDDTLFAIQPIGFAFPVGGATYTDVHISTNGFFYLSNAGTPAPGLADFNSTQAEFSSGPPRVAPVWTDFNMLAANNADVLIENTTGTVCRITWLNAQPYLGFNVQGPTFTVQCELFPNGDVTFYYGDVANGGTAGTGFNAITGITPGGGVTLPAASDLLTAGATTDATVFEEWAVANTFDLANNSLQLIAANPGYAFVANGPQGDCASVSTYGEGCNNLPNSFHELIADGNWDLGTKTISLVRGSTDYTALDAIPGTFVTPTAGATVVADGDDTVETVTLSTAISTPVGSTTDVNVCSNGFITLGGTTPPTDWSPTVDEFLAFDNTTICAQWGDLDPTEPSSGKITFEEIGGVAYITWDNVYGQAETVGDTFQIQIELATGVISVVYVSHNTAGPYLVGYKADGASTLERAIDVSADLAGAITVRDMEARPLALDANKPVLGTNWDFVTSNIDAVSPVSATFFGTAPIAVPGGVPLSTIGLPAPGCVVLIDTILANATAVSVAGESTLTLPLPLTPSLAGATLSAQSICFTTSNVANLLTSNGVFGRVGF